MPSHQLPKPTAILEDNTTNYPNLPSDKESISSGASNDGKEGIRSMGNDNNNIRPANIDQ